MKKFILPILLFPFFLIVIPQANAQKTLNTCEELKELLEKQFEKTDECKYWILPQQDDGYKFSKLWCFSEPDTVTDQGSAYIQETRMRPPDYIMAFDYEKCTEGLEPGLTVEGGQSPPKKTAKEEGQLSSLPKAIWQAISNVFDILPKKQTETVPQEISVPSDGTLSPQAVNDWIMENDLKLNPAQMQKMEKEKFEQEIYGRTPQITEEIIKQYREKYNKMFESSESEQKETSFNVIIDYITGDAAYKLPGSDEWIDLKVGDVLPSGATLWTGMDSTVLVNMKNKGIAQMLSFTEIVISEQAVEGNSFTDIKIKTGEIELSPERGVFGPSLQIQTPSSQAGVRGHIFG